ncbi:hypothetical protein [Paludisphaera rhizosphaerae]|uniref:hypothetical protein n=1 Tax=Paludisphaera rhizosphaerae TaxID=2711216 RepID=UPI0013EAB18D|nr:hypothetical protein [Paludisphaera rhizosphaerae]
MSTTQTSTPPTRRLRAAVIGIGLDGGDDLQRLTRSAQCLVVGGSAETHAEMREAMTRIELELETMQRRLSDLNPQDLADLAFRVDLPELHELAVRMEEGLERQGREFLDLSAEELAALLDLEGTGAVVGS